MSAPNVWRSTLPMKILRALLLVKARHPCLFRQKIIYRRRILVVNDGFSVVPPILMCIVAMLLP